MQSLNLIMETQMPGTTVVQSKLADKQYFIPYCYDHLIDRWYGISDAAKSPFPVVTRMRGSRDMWEVIQDENSKGRKTYNKYTNSSCVKMLYAISMALSEGRPVKWDRKDKDE